MFNQYFFRAYRSMQCWLTNSRWDIFDMNIEIIYSRLTPIFQEIFDNDDIIPHSEMTANDVSEWDSLSNIRLVVAVEEEFGIQFSTGEVAGLSNVGEFVSVIQHRVNGWS